MRPIKGFSDIENIIKGKFDVTDAQGYRVPFVRFMSMPLLEIVGLFNKGWTYESILY